MPKQESGDEAASPSFMCGVCEGFYGKPWSADQRKELFSRMEKMGLDTYLYAPKDDYKHRLFWRDAYSPDESVELASLIKSAEEHSLHFVYAISPGLDITFTNVADVTALKNKLSQVSGLGCKSFAILFDDIEQDLCPEDEEVFDSPGHAQAKITNEVYHHLNKPKIFLFCPTEYCTSRTVPDLANSDYLLTIGKILDKGVDILWTGPKVVSRTITPESIKDVTRVIQRPPVIWDNLHANDYDQTRLFLGAYEGRPIELLKLLRGVLTNPNCEYEANFIAMHTLAQWSHNKVQSFPSLHGQEGDTQCDVDMDGSKVDPVTHDVYQSKLALVHAVKDWIPMFYQPKGSSRCRSQDKSKSKEKESESITNDSVKSKKSSPKSNDAKNSGKRKIEDLDPLNQEDVLILCDLFYLPFEHGPRAVHLLKEAHWLISSADKVQDCYKVPKGEQPQEAREWYGRAMAFHDLYKDIATLVDKFVNIPNRVLLYELYTYISDMRGVISMINSHIKWHGMGKPEKENNKGGDQEPWVYRGGLHAELRRLLPVEGESDMFPSSSRASPGKKVYTIRPYFPSDKSEVYAVCRKTKDDGLDASDIYPDYPDLLADESIGAMLEFHREHCFVIEDDVGICGYVAVTPDIKMFQSKLPEMWFSTMQKKYPKPKESKHPTAAEEAINVFYSDVQATPKRLCEKYPAYLSMGMISSRIEDFSTPKRLLKCAINTLKLADIKGVHTVIDASYLKTLALHIRLGFEDITDDNESTDEMLVLGHLM